MFFMVYKNSKGWNWNLSTTNYQTLGTSWGHYRTKEECLDVLNVLLSSPMHVYDCGLGEWLPKPLPHEKRNVNRQRGSKLHGVTEHLINSGETPPVHLAVAEGRQ